jgi:hypothetical protein
MREPHLEIPFRHDVDRLGARQDERAEGRAVRAARHDDAVARTRDAEDRSVVADRRSVDEEERAVGTPRIGSETLCIGDDAHWIVEAVGLGQGRYVVVERCRAERLDHVVARAEAVAMARRVE